MIFEKMNIGTNNTKPSNMYTKGLLVLDGESKLKITIINDIGNIINMYAKYIIAFRIFF